MFNNLVPTNAFEAMQLQKTAVEKMYGNSCYAWHDGIQVNIGALQITALRRASQSTISLCVSALSDDLEQVWQVTPNVYSDLEAVIKPLPSWFILNASIALLNIYSMYPAEVLHNEWPDVTYEYCKKIPRALVIAPSGELAR